MDSKWMRESDTKYTSLLVFLKFVKASKESPSK